MPVKTRSTSKKQNMDKSKDESETGVERIKGHSSPRPVRKPATASGSNVRKRSKPKDEMLDETRQKGKNEDSHRDYPDGEADYLSNDEEQSEDEIQEDYSFVKSVRPKISKEKARYLTKIQEQQPPAVSGQRNVDNKPVMILSLLNGTAAVALFAIIVLAYMYVSVSKPVSNLQPEFQQDMLKIKSFFPSQEQHFWEMVEATVDDHLDHGSYPEGPIVLLFGSQPDGSDTTKCLAKKLGSILSRALSVHRPDMVLIDGKDFKSMKDDEAKVEVDERLEAGFDQGQKAAVILNLDALPPCSILLFHGYCENDNARYKDVALIFTVTLDGKNLLPQEANRSKPLHLKREEAFQISEHLTRVWTDKCSKLPEEKVEAMLSRVANNVGIVKTDKVVSC